MRARLTIPAEIAQYLSLGHGTFTIKSSKTGTHYTYKMNTPKDLEHGRKRPLWVSILAGPDNETSYVYAGTIWVGENQPWGLKPTAKSKMSLDTPSVKALNWFLHFLNQGAVHETVEFWHEGVCGHCGRKLTTPESIARGIGPTCARRLG